MATVTAEYTPLLEKTLASSARVIVHVGGAGSSKSHSIAQRVVQAFLSHAGIRIGITRKTFPALRRTAYDLVIRLLREWGVYDRLEHNKSEHSIRYQGSLLDFFSLDDPVKIQSADYNLLWLEEANEFSYEDWITLSLRLRAPLLEGLKRNQAFLSLNPSDGNGWIPLRLVGQSDVEVIHSTYKDNPFLDSSYIQTLKDLINQDENYYRIYTLGEWGKLENLVLSKYQQVPALPTEWQVWAYGLDFGFSNPTALTKVMLADGKVYLDERIYRTKLTNADLIELLSHEERADIYADSAEPQRIEEITRAGYRVYQANKDVKYGLDLLKRQSLNITAESADLLKEIRSYQHKKDKDGRILEEPVKFNDHAIDAARYAICGLTERVGLATRTRPSGKPVTIRWW